MMAEIRRLVAVAVAGNEARNYIDLVCCGWIVTNVTEGLLHQLRSQLSIDDVLTLLLFRTDKVAAVHANTVLHHGCHDVRTQTLTIADDGVLRLLRQVVNEVHTIVDTLQLVEELVYIIK